MNFRHQNITHHKEKGNPSRSKSYRLVPNTVTVELPEIKSKSGQIIRKAMTWQKPIVKQITHRKTA